MAKLTREVIGTVGNPQKKDDGKVKHPYIKFKKNVSFKEGDYVTVETKKSRLASIEQAVKSGKMSEEVYEKLKEQINKTPDWVMGELVRLVEQAS